MTIYRGMILVFLLIFLLGLGGCLFDKDNYRATLSNKVVKKEDIMEKPLPISKVEAREHEDMIIINKGTFTLHLIKNGKEVAAYPCAIGKNRGQKQESGDMRTPTGEFYIDEIIDSSAWTHDFADGRGAVQGAYGPWFLSIDTTELSQGAWNGIGIHGTNVPDSIGTRASEGCIRLHNQDIENLKRQVRVGMKVKIVE